MLWRSVFTKYFAALTTAQTITLGDVQAAMKTRGQLMSRDENSPAQIQGFHSLRIGQVSVTSMIFLQIASQNTGAAASSNYCAAITNTSDFNMSITPADFPLSVFGEAAAKVTVEVGNYSD